MRKSDPYAREPHDIRIRFYAELNDFLPERKRRGEFTHTFVGTPSVKDSIEAIGVPHTEVDVIFVDGASVGFSHLLRGGERVSVYPVFERFNISPVTRLRPAPLRVTRFIADVHLGTLARYLRLLGIDTTWDSHLADDAIVTVAAGERRIILTRDKGLLKNGRVTHGYWVRATDPMQQLDEVVRALDLADGIEPYTRCMTCNGTLVSISRLAALRAVPLRVFLVCRDFRRCGSCKRVYWRGSHGKRLERIIEAVREAQ